MDELGVNLCETIVIATGRGRGRVVYVVTAKQAGACGGLLRVWPRPDGPGQRVAPAVMWRSTSMDGFVVIEFKITCVEEHVALRACALRVGAGRSRRGV